MCELRASAAPPALRAGQVQKRPRSGPLSIARLQDTSGLINSPFDHCYKSAPHPAVPFRPGKCGLLIRPYETGPHWQRQVAGCRRAPPAWCFRLCHPQCHWVRVLLKSIRMRRQNHPQALPDNKRVPLLPHKNHRVRQPTCPVHGSAASSACVRCHRQRLA